jgi:hypothetical protein
MYFLVLKLSHNASNYIWLSANINNNNNNNINSLFSLHNLIFVGDDRIKCIMIS